MRVHTTLVRTHVSDHASLRFEVALVAPYPSRHRQSHMLMPQYKHNSGNNITSILPVMAQTREPNARQATKAFKGVLLYMVLVMHRRPLKLVPRPSLLADNVHQVVLSPQKSSDNINISIHN
jgi:hypothetical protein